MKKTILKITAAVVAAVAAFAAFSVHTIIGTKRDDMFSVAVDNAAEHIKGVLSEAVAEAAERDRAEKVKAAARVELAAMLEARAGDWSLYFLNYDTGDEISINSHQVYSASLIKLFVIHAVYQRMAEGSLSDSDALENQLYRMITISDNDAWRNVAQRLGGSYSNGMRIVTEIAQAAGYSDTGTFYKGPYRNFNFTSVNDCGAYLKGVLDGTVVNPEYSAKILSLLKQQQHRHKLPAGVPEGIETANKTGELDYNQGDAMIVFSSGGTYILVLIGDGLTNSYGSAPFFGEVSQYVYNYVNQEG